MPAHQGNISARIATLLSASMYRLKEDTGKIVFWNFMINN